MSFQIKTLSACALMATPAVGSAQDFSGAATLGYGHSSISNGGGDANSYTLDGRGAFDLRNGFSIGLDGSLVYSDPDGPGDNGAVDIGAKLQYQLYSGAVFGGYLDYIDLDGSGQFGGDADATSYGLTGGYKGRTLQMEVNLGWTDASVSGLGSTGNWMDYGVNIAYTPTERTKIAGHWQLSDLDTAFGSTNLSSIGIGASHDFGAGFLGFAGITRVDYDAFDIDATSYGLGVGYDLQQVSNLPGQISLELARTNLDAAGFGDANVDTIRLGFTMPLGNRATSAPLNSLADSIMSPRHNAISTLSDNVF